MKKIFLLGLVLYLMHNSTKSAVLPAPSNTVISQLGKPVLNPETAATMRSLLTVFQSKKPETKHLQHHPLFQTLDLDSGTPTVVSFGKKKYRILNPNNPALETDAEKHLAKVPVEIENVTEDQALTNTQAKTIQQLEKAQEDLQEEIQIASSYIPAQETAEFLQINTPGITVEGYCGEEFTQNGTIILYAIHGTWSNKAAFSGDIMTETSYNIFKFACQLALAEKKQIKIISVSWSGELHPNERHDAASKLANDAIQRMEHEKPVAIWVIAHSHGCNVAARAANRIFDKEGKLLDVAIFLASPTLDIPRQLDYKTVYAFYSQGDFTQAAGSIQGGRNFDRKVPFALPQGLAEGKRVYNIRTQMNGYDMDHVSIKWGVIPHLAKILTYIDTYYPCNFDLELDIQNKPNSLPLLAIRHQEPNCGGVDLKAFEEGARAKNEFTRRYASRNRGAMSKMGIKYISGLTWLFNFVNEGKSAWKGEPTIGAEYLQEIVPTASQPKTPIAITPASQQPSSSQTAGNWFTRWFNWF